MIEPNKIILGNSKDVLKTIESETFDFIITSPPYSAHRVYDGEMDFNFSVFKIIAKELARVLKPGGSILWNVNDQTVDGSEDMMSFKQAFYFRNVCGLNLYDTMIYQKKNYMPLNHRRYDQAFEYMFLFAKGIPKTFNPIMLKTKNEGRTKRMSYVCANSNEKGSAMKSGLNITTTIKAERLHNNIFDYAVGSGQTSVDNFIFKEHSAIMPEELVKDQLLTWTDEGDLVLDPFCGSGTVPLMCKKYKRNYVGVEISEKFCNLIERRLKNLDTREDFLTLKAKDNLDNYV